MSELKIVLEPCPFCGGEAKIDEWPTQVDIKYMGYCKNKKCETVQMYSSNKDEAIRRWNRRAGQ